MRYLTVVRHAKATAAAPGADDFERPLSARGRRQCEELRAWVNDPSGLDLFGPVTALVSSARRTRETFRRAFEDTPFVHVVLFSDLIYNGRRDVTAEDLLIDLAGVDPVTTSLLVVAHNPTVHELVASLAEVTPPVLVERGFPVGGAVVLELRDDQPVGLARYRVVAEYFPDGRD